MSFSTLVASDVGVDVTVVEPGTVTDDYGDTILDWSDDAVTETATRGKFTQSGTRRVFGGRDALVDDDELHLLADAPVTERCRFLIDGDTWESDGAPYLAPRGSHWRVKVKRVVG